MENKKAPHHHSTEPASRATHSKDKYFKREKKLFFNYLQENTATSSMASAALGIPQKNLTRYKRELEKAGLLMVVCTSICRVTKHRADYLTTSDKIIKALNHVRNR